MSRISVEYFDDPQEIIITADADGLKYLADVCQGLIGKVGPAAHWHLSEGMGTVEAGSIETCICYLDD